MDASLAHADRLVKATPAVRRWAHAFAEWWRVALAGDDPDEEHRLRHLANAAWWALNEPERQSAWSWYRAHGGI